MKTGIVAIAAMALSVMIADGASAKPKRHRTIRHHAPVLHVPMIPSYAARPRPPWGQPFQCFDDLGNGRFMPCGAAPSIN
jgi:hypothetical protein